MALKGRAKTDYQREYMKRWRALRKTKRAAANPPDTPHRRPDQPMNDLAEHLSDEDEVVEQLQWVACRRTEASAVRS